MSRDLKRAMLAAVLLGLFLAPRAIAGEAAGANTMHFQFDHQSYRDKKTGRNWPRHVTAMVIVRNENKRRPLWIVGKNDSGTLTLKFDDMAGLAKTYQITSTGSARVNMSRVSATPALDAKDFAVPDWLEGETFPTIAVRIKSLSAFEARDKKMKELLSLNSRSNFKERKKLVAKYSALMEGEFLVGEKTVPIKQKVGLSFREGAGYYVMNLAARFTLKGSAIGLTGPEATQDVQISFVTTAYSAPPVSQKAPDLDSMEMDMEMDLGLD